MSGGVIYVPADGFDHAAVKLADIVSNERIREMHFVMGIRPVLQTRFGAPEGNCYPAALASILGVPLSALPDWRWPAGVPAHSGIGYDGANPPTPEQKRATDDCHDHYAAVLATFGFAACQISVPENPADLWLPADAVTVGSVENKRGLLHAVVCFNGRIVWDPNPRQDSYTCKVLHHVMLVAQKPGRMRLR